MRQAEEFKQQSKKHGITSWTIHNCSICDYPCGYEFHDDGSVHYDAGCDCVTYSRELEPRDWQDVAGQYNLQDHPNVIAEYDAFWKFEEEKEAEADEK